MIMRFFIFVFMVMPAWIGSTYYDAVIRPELSTRLAMQAVNGNKDDSSLFRFSQKYAYWPQFAALGWTLTSAYVCFGKYTRRNYIKYKKETVE